MTTTNRRAFLKTAGIAAGAASLAASPAPAAAGEPAAVETAPSGPIPGEPIVAVIRDAGSGQVTVFSGTAKNLLTVRSSNGSSGQPAKTTRARRG